MDPRKDGPTDGPTDRRTHPLSFESGLKCIDSVRSTSLIIKIVYFDAKVARLGASQKEIT